MKNLAVALLCFSLILPHPALMAPVTAQSTNEAFADDIEEHLAFVDELMDQLEQARANINRGAFDLDALVESLDFDAEALINFVSKEIAFQPYVGALRGAKGALASGAGNALDQSILLASLLKQAGYDARIVRSRLTSSQAELLLSKMLPDSLDFGNVFSSTPELFADSFGEVQRQVESKNWLDPAIEEEIHEVAETLIRFLEAKGVVLGDARFYEKLMDDAMDYFAVDYREGPAKPWSLVHPAFGGADIKLDGSPRLAVYNDQIPDELLHRLTFQAFAEVRFGSEVRQEAIMDTLTVPTSNMIGREFRFSIVPENIASVREKLEAKALELEGSAESDVLELIDIIARSYSSESTMFFFPLFNGNLASGAKIFDLQGNVLSADLPITPAVGTFKTVAESMKGAISALNDMEGVGERNEQRITSLERLWVVYEVVSPTGRSESFSRDLFVNQELKGAEKGVHEHGLRFTQEVSFMAATGRPNLAYLLDRQLAHLIGLRDALLDAYRLFLEGENAKAEEVLINEGALADELDFLKLFYAFDSWGAADGIGSYRDSASLVAFESGISVGSIPKLFVGVDIVRNERKVIDIRSGKPVLAPEVAIQYGVWETFVEKVFTESQLEGFEMMLEAKGIWSAFSVLSERNVEAPRMTLVASKDDVDSVTLEGLSVSSRAVKDELARGNILVLANSGPGAPAHAWWSVQPKTGSVIGVGGDGRGKSMLEYIVVWGAGKKIAFTTTRFTHGLAYIVVCGFAAKMQAGRGNQADATGCVATASVIWAFGLRTPMVVSLAIIVLLKQIFGPLRF